MRPLLLILLIALISSCSFFIKKIDQLESSKKSAHPQNLTLLFSHNISGETHPCGCRNFPLGGLAQVAGLHQKLKADSEVFYVDTGDTFFPSSVLPESMKDSLSFAANNLALGLDLLGLKYLVPGDQDFALGVEFLDKISKTRRFNLLISNLKDENLLKHQRFAIIERGKSKVFLLGLVLPDVFNKPELIDLFIEPSLVLPKLIDELKSQGYNPKNSYHRLVVLSHAGIDPDEKLAASFPFIDWIIGAHSQSFLRLSRDVGNVKMVQVLSKNHYVGGIAMDMNAKKESDLYTLHEIRDELEQNLNPNPLRSFIDEHKTKMNDIQLQEQARMSGEAPKKAPIVKFRTSQSCLECHRPQSEFWQTTSHSIAYTTLMKAREPNNLQCVKCHSLGLHDPRGFSSTKNMVSFKHKPIADYWQQVEAFSADIKSARKASPEQISKVAQKWIELDKKSKVKHNFANVQCLNCHSTKDDHPFNTDVAESREQKMAHTKKQCLSCHSPDQSPEWYENDQKMLNEKIFSAKLKEVSCPQL